MYKGFKARANTDLGIKQTVDGASHNIDALGTTSKT